MTKTIEMSLKKLPENTPEIGDKLKNFIDSGPFIVIEPNEEEKRIIGTRRDELTYKFSVADGSFLKLKWEFETILVLSLGVKLGEKWGESEGERIVNIIGKYDKGSERYNELYPLLQD